MTSGRSGLRLLRPDDGRFASWCGSCAKARIALGIGTSGRKLNAQDQLVAAIALMLAGVGVWATSTIQARINVPASAQIDPLQVTMGARHLPVAQYDDYSLVFPN